MNFSIDAVSAIGMDSQASSVEDRYANFDTTEFLAVSGAADIEVANPSGVINAVQSFLVDGVGTLDHAGEIFQSAELSMVDVAKLHVEVINFSMKLNLTKSLHEEFKTARDRIINER